MYLTAISKFDRWIETFFLSLLWLRSNWCLILFLPFLFRSRQMIKPAHSRALSAKLKHAEIWQLNAPSFSLSSSSLHSPVLPKSLLLLFHFRQAIDVKQHRLICSVIYDEYHGEYHIGPINHHINGWDKCQSIAPYLVGSNAASHQFGLGPFTAENESNETHCQWWFLIVQQYAFGSSDQRVLRQRGKETFDGLRKTHVRLSTWHALQSRRESRPTDRILSSPRWYWTWQLFPSETGCASVGQRYALRLSPFLWESRLAFEQCFS